MARPRIEFVLNEEGIEKLSEIGVTTQEMADVFGCSKDTIERRYAANLTKGRAKLRIALRLSMLKSAFEHDSVAMKIFLSKNLLKMSDAPEDAEALNAIKETLEKRSTDELLQLAVNVRELALQKGKR